MDDVICAHNGQEWATRKGVYSKLLNRGQHGSDTAACTETDPPGAAQDRERSLMSRAYDCLGVLKKTESAWRVYEVQYIWCIFASLPR